MEGAALPPEIRLEVKTSRSGVIPVSARDLAGVADAPGGYLAALVNDRLLHGPRWVLVPVALMQARGWSEAELVEVASASLSDGMGLALLTEGLNRRWSDWILDQRGWERILGAGTTGIAARVAWCRREHPPRVHAFTGAVREGKLAAALVTLRERIDIASPAGEAGAGSQVEGQLHQGLLAHVLEEMGYEVTINPVGVPDIVAISSVSLSRRQIGACDMRKRIEAWDPDSASLQQAKAVLLELSGEELESVRVVVTPED